MSALAGWGYPLSEVESLLTARPDQGEAGVEVEDPDTVSDAEPSAGVHLHVVGGP